VISREFEEIVLKLAIEYLAKLQNKKYLRFQDGFGPITLPIRGLPNTTILQYKIAENHETRFV